MLLDKHIHTWAGQWSSKAGLLTHLRTDFTSLFASFPTSALTTWPPHSLQTAITSTSQQKKGPSSLSQTHLETYLHKHPPFLLVSGEETSVTESSYHHDSSLSSFPHWLFPINTYSSPSLSILKILPQSYALSPSRTSVHQLFE